MMIPGQGHTVAGWRYGVDQFYFHHRVVEMACTYRLDGAMALVRFIDGIRSFLDSAKQQLT